MTQTTETNRRNFLKNTGAALVAASLPIAAVAQKEDEYETENEAARPQPVYLNGCGWNRSLPGVYGQACFAFEARAELGGTGVGTIRDDVHPEVNSQFQITEAVRTGRNQYSFRGRIISSRSPQLIGHQVTIISDYIGNGQARASLTIVSPGNDVVIAIIAILIGLLLLPSR
jgi:hypothetical protein